MQFMVVCWHSPTSLARPGLSPPATPINVLMVRVLAPGPLLLCVLAVVLLFGSAGYLLVTFRTHGALGFGLHALQVAGNWSQLMRL
ncbi:MAG: hypothetical protein GY696_16055 [Gammaproteobacteria bacterium]|nr:hypothetical protein [Gammaproteobacteria bacterium]